MFKEWCVREELAANQNRTEFPDTGLFAKWQWKGKGNHLLGLFYMSRITGPFTHFLRAKLGYVQAPFPEVTECPNIIFCVEVTNIFNCK